MTASRDPDQLIHAYFDEGLDELPDPVYDAVRDRIEQTPQRADLGSWRTPTMNNLKNTLKIALAAAAAAVVVIVGLGTLRSGPVPGASPSATPSASAPSAAVTELLNRFIAARVAGTGAEEYLDLENTTAENIPLLYATTSGARYDRAEFEPVAGFEWPYGWTAFKVRLFAGDTVVEQLVFAGPDSSGLNYQSDGFGTHIAPTTENGQPVAMPYDYFDGEVTLHAANPWIMFGYAPFGRLIPEGPGVLPTTDGGERHDGWDSLFMQADPLLISKYCQVGPVPANAAALAESIRSDPDLQATAPVAVRVAGTNALVMDVKIAAGAMVCRVDPAGSADGPAPEVPHDGVLRPVWDTEAATSAPNSNGLITGHATGDWMRLYLFDVPDGLSMRILVIAIVAPEARFERAVEEAAPVIDSIEFQAP